MCVCVCTFVPLRIGPGRETLREAGCGGLVWRLGVEALRQDKAKIIHHCLWNGSPPPLASEDVTAAVLGSHPASDRSS